MMDVSLVPLEMADLVGLRPRPEDQPRASVIPGGSPDDSQQEGS